MRMSILLVSAILAALSAQSGEVSGQFKATSKGTIKPKFVAAFPVRAPGNPMEKSIVVILSEGAMDPSAALESLDPHTAVINQGTMQKKNYISLRITPGGHIGMNATFRDGWVQFIDGTNVGKGGESFSPQGLEAKLTENSAKRIAGSVRTTKPVKAYSGSFELNVQFDTEVTHLAGTTTLRAGGGDPGKALMKLLPAIQKKNWKSVKSGVTAKNLESMDPAATDAQNYDNVIGIFARLLPQGKAKILAGEQRGDVADLTVQGSMGEGVEAYYMVRMIKEAGGWKFERSTIAGFV